MNYSTKSNLYVDYQLNMEPLIIPNKNTDNIKIVPLTTVILCSNAWSPLALFFPNRVSLVPVTVELSPELLPSCRITDNISTMLDAKITYNKKLCI